MVEALVFEKLKDNLVRCGVCQRRCLISEGKTGFCLSKINKGGKLFSLNYGLIRGIQVDPVEKKPFYHFKPGALVPSIGNFGCNFRCRQCLNWWCSWGEPATTILKDAADGKGAKILEPANLIEQMKLLERSFSPNESVTLSRPSGDSEIKKTGCRGIAFTYNEPIIWAEYALDTARIAKEQGFFTIFVTNGSWTKETLDILGPFIDAANIDFKGFFPETYAKQGAFWGVEQENIFTMAKYAEQKHKIFLEITTLLIPGINDGKEELAKLAEWMVKNLGAKAPWHLSRFEPELAPDQEFKKIPATSIEKLKEAARIGREAGLDFVYIWAPGQDLPDGLYAEGDTICPKCKKLVIKRDGWQPEIIGVDGKGNCSNCGESLNIVL